MTFSTLPLSYCTNVHPGLSILAVHQGLEQYTAKIQDRTQFPVAAGLWLAQPVIDELVESPDGARRLHEQINQLGLSCYTLNAFPYGNFHAERVKENVYLPDWSQQERYDYTLRCAQVLADLLPQNVEGSISTVPLGFKEFEHDSDFENRCISSLIQLARHLEELYQATGKRIRLAIEPEPFCRLETTTETVAFFDRLRTFAADQNVLDEVSEYLGVCYDVCHQAVEFEDVAASIRTLTDSGIRINKVHITCAIELNNPLENIAARESLARYAEPRYLHQTIGRSSTGSVLRFVDLTQEFARNPGRDFEECDKWRIHFHVPVNAEQLGPLGTTRNELRLALAAVAELAYSPHLEVETYTWEVLPEQDSTTDLVGGLAEEMRATHSLLGELSDSTAT